ncbi:MAG: glycosyltransferase [Clostridia bacterium]|nr:glycosyltransferase [Clostridia bacterium]
MDTDISAKREVKISVIMPIYNAGEYLARAVSDVLNQTLTDIELICVNDGSTDDSYDILEEVQQEDGRISLISEDNFGPSVARNRGLREATGKYVMFLDADDMFEPTLLETLYEIAERDNLDVAVTGFDIYNDSQNRLFPATEEPNAAIFAGGGVTSKNEHPDYILSSTTGYVWNKLYRASFIRDKKLTFDPDLYVFEDVHFVCCAMATAERVGMAEGINVHHRIYSEQSRATLFRKYYGQVPVVYEKVKEFLMQRGMYVPLKRGFLNLSANRCYKIYNILWNDGKERLWNMLHSHYAAELDWLTIEKTDYQIAEVCQFVANVALYTHEEYLDRTEKGMNINVAALEKDEISNKVKTIQKSEQRKESWSRFAGLFKKK